MISLELDDAIGERSPSRLLRRISRMLDRRHQERFSDSDQSFEEWWALKLIHDGLVESAGDLTREFNIGSGATTRLIDSLEVAGLVERDRTQDDRRLVLLKVTPAGQKHYRRKVRDMLDCWNDLLRDFKKDELEQLIVLLEKLQSALTRDDKK